MSDDTRLTIILGGPASGKTTLARRLAEALGCTCLSKDDVKEALFDVLGIGDRVWSRRLSDASFTALLRLAERQLAVGGRCVVEGNFRPEHGAAWREVARRYGVKARQIWCHAPPATILARFDARRRHPGHLDGVVLRAEVEAHAAQPVTFLDLDGETSIYDPAQPLAFERLCGRRTEA